MKIELEDYLGNTVRIIDLDNYEFADFESEDHIRLQKIDNLPIDKNVEFQKELADLKSRITTYKDNVLFEKQLLLMGRCKDEDSRMEYKKFTDAKNQLEGHIMYLYQSICNLQKINTLIKNMR